MASKIGEINIWPDALCEISGKCGSKNVHAIKKQSESGTVTAINFSQLGSRHCDNVNCHNVYDLYPQ